MNFYIASKLENYKQVQNLAKLLKNFRWKYTCDWTERGSIKETDVKTLKSVGEKIADR